jgi:hypothetical protein
LYLYAPAPVAVNASACGGCLSAGARCSCLSPEEIAMVLSELLATLRAEGLPAKAHVIHHAIQAGYLPTPERDGSGRFRFAATDVKACRTYLKNVPKPGRKKATASA